jgi:hypothetical protein
MSKAAQRERDRAKPRRRRSFCLQIERLEDRTLLTITSTYTAATGLLTVSSDANDEITITKGDDGNTLISGQEVPSTNGGPAPAAMLQQVRITGGPGGSVIKPGALFSSDFSALQAVSVDGAGVGTLVGPNAASTWNVTDQNSGTLDAGMPNITFTFSNVPNFTGGDTDIFSYQNDRAQVTGVIDGGDKALTLKNALASTSSGKLEISNTVLDRGGDITIQAGTSITVDAGVTISSRQTEAGGDPRTAPSTGNSGAVMLTAPQISIGNGASILANADSNHQSGDVTLQAKSEVTLNEQNLDLTNLGTISYQTAQTTTAINIGSATIKGNNVMVTGQSSTVKMLTETQNLTDSRAVVFADLTGDGLLDMIVGNYNGPVQVYLNNGTADPYKGVPPITLTNADPTVALAVGDVNGDGLPDLIVGNQGAPTRLYLNNGNKFNPFGGVVPIDITPANSPTTSVALVDPTGKGGLPDLIVGNNSTGANTVTPSQLYLNTGNHENPFGGTPLPITGADYTTSLAVADVNNDDLPDLVVGQVGLAGSTGEPTRLFLNSGNPTNPFSTAPIDIGYSPKTSAVVLADVTGNGRPDLIVGNNGAPTQLYMNSHMSSNPFGETPQSIGGNDPTTSLAVADVTGSGHLDLIVGNSQAPTRLYLNNGSTSPFSTAQDITASADDTRSVALGELLNGGLPDLVVGLNGNYPRVYVNNDTATPFSATPSMVNPAPELLYQVNESAVFPFALPLPATLAHAESDITIGSGATIAADGKATLMAQAMADAEQTTSGVFGLGGAYVDSEATANVSVGTGATITAGGAFDLEALTQNTVKISTEVPKDASPGAILFSYEKARSNSSADVAAGAQVTAAGATIRAQNTNTFSNVCESAGPASLGVAVAISDPESTATASVHGSVHTMTNDTTVDAESVNTGNTTVAKGAITSTVAQKGLLGFAITQLQSKLATIPFVQDIGNAIIAAQGASSGPPVAISAGVAVAQSLNTADAFVGSQGKITADTGNVTINANAQDNFNSYAVGSAGEAGFASVGGAVADSQTTNQANAYLDAGATVDAGLSLQVKAEANIPNPVQLSLPTFLIPSDNTGTNTSINTARVLAGYNEGAAAALKMLESLQQLRTYVNQVLSGLSALPGQTQLKNIGTTYAQSEGVAEQNATIGIAGAVNLFTVDNTANAYIGNGASVNQHLSSSPTQNVQVEADTDLETIDLTGQASTLSYAELFKGAGGSKGGVGGSFENLTYNNTAHAYIDNNAKVSAGGNINVNANTTNVVVSVAQAGAKSEVLGIDGAMIFFNLNNDTEAWIADGAAINAGQDLQVMAINRLTDIVVTGGLASGGDIGVGVSGSYNNLTNTTKAFIGASGTPGTLGSIMAGHNITVQATSNAEIDSIGISGTYSPGSSNPTSTDPLDGETLPMGVATEGKEFGIGFSGDVGLNFLVEDTEAYINGTGMIKAGSELKVAAGDTSKFNGAAGSVAYVNHIGVGGSVALENLQETTKAFTQGAALEAGDIVIAATSTPTLVGVAAGGSAAKKAASVAGSVNLNFLSNDTEAYLGNGTTATTTTGDVTITATNTLYTVTVAGVADASLGYAAAAGAALDLGTYNSKVLTSISIGSSANVSSAGGVTVKAASSEKLRSVGASLALAFEKKGPGASGSGAAQSLTDDVEASIGSGSVVQAQGSVSITADDNTDLLVIGGSVTPGNPVGVGLSAGAGIASRTVKAYLDSKASVSAPDKNVVVQATTEDENLVFAAGLVGDADVALAASAVVDTENSDIEAFIGQSATVTSGSVKVHAEEDTNYITVAGSYAHSGKLGLGAAAQVQVISRTVKAHIDSSAKVSADANNVEVSAAAPEQIIAVAAGVGASGGVLEIAGSATVFTLTNDTEAFIGNSATVSAPGSIWLSASANLNFTPTAGAVGIPDLEKGAGVGASNSTLVANNTTLAYIGSSATITALGQDSVAPVSVSTGQNGSEAPYSIHGLSLTAVFHLNVLAIAAGAAGGGQFGVAGSATVNMLTDVTRAYVDQSTTINKSNTGAGKAQDINLLASDLTTITNVAGSAAVNRGFLGIGGGADVEVLNKDTEAYLAPSVTAQATEHVLINAISNENLLSIAGSIGVTGDNGGIAGAASVVNATLRTNAYIGASAVVGAGGNVVLAANDDSNLYVVDGTLAGNAGAGFSLSGSVAIPIISKTTQAFIDADAIVDALGTKGPSSVRTGTFTASFVSPTSSDPVMPPALNPNSDAAQDMFFKKFFTMIRGVVTPDTTNIQGVAVTATATDRVLTVAASLSGSSTVGIAIVGSVYLPTTTTIASISHGAKVNPGAAASGTPESAQSVLVAAGSDYYHLGIAGSAAITLNVSANPGADVLVSTNTTIATIGFQAQVDAQRDVKVQASQGGSLVSFVAGLTAGGTAVTGSASVVALKDTTIAYIQPGGQVNAGGNVLVQATDNTYSSMLAGTVALNLVSPVPGVGGSLGLNLIIKDTEAYVAAGAMVNAMGKNSTRLTVLDDTKADMNAGLPATTTINGLAVQAYSSTGVFSIAVAGSGGLFGGLAGAVTVTIIQAKSVAYIGNGAKVNEGLTGADPTQSVSVGAGNDASIRGIDGVAGAGLYGDIAGGVDVGLIGNFTDAYIDSNAHVYANGGIGVLALSNETGNSKVISVGAAAGVGLAGAVSVYAFDGNLDTAGSTDAATSLNSRNGNGQTTGGYADDVASAKAITGQLGKYKMIPGNNSSGQVMNAVQNASNMVQQTAPKGLTSGLLGVVGTQGTGAFVGGSALVSAGSTVKVVAHDEVDLNLLAGGGTFGGVLGVGGSVVVAHISNQTNAYVGSSATVAAATSDSTGKVVVYAIFAEGGLSSNPAFPALTAKASAGEDVPNVTGAGLVGLGAQWVEINDDSQQNAYLNNGAKVTNANQVLVRADVTRHFDAEATGVTGALGLAAGVAFAQVNVPKTSQTNAYTGTGVQIGEQAGQAVQSLTITAINFTTAGANASAIAAGLLFAGQVNSARSEISPTIQAYIGAGSQVLVGQNIMVSAVSEEAAGATVSGANVDNVSGLLFVGASFADATIAPMVQAYIDSNPQNKTVVTASTGSVGVFAQDSPSSAIASGSASGISAVTGQGATITANANAMVNSFIQNNATVNALGTIQVYATGINFASANASTFALGVGFNVAAISATATAGGGVSAKVGSSVAVGTPAQPAGSLDIEARGQSQSTASVDLSGGGAFNKTNFSSATANTVPTFQASIGGGSKVYVSGNVTVKSSSMMIQGHATMTGATGGIKNANQSQAIVKVAPMVLASIDSKADSKTTVTAGGTITVKAEQDQAPTQDPDAQGPLDTSAVAYSSGGGLISDVGAVAMVQELPTTSAAVGDGAQLSAGGDISITSTSYANTTALATSKNGNVLGSGGGNALITITNATSATVGANTVIITQGNFTLTANSFNTIAASSDAYNAVTAVSGITANTIVLVSPQTQVSVGQGAKITAGSDLQVAAYSKTSAIRPITTLPDPNNQLPLPGFPVGAYVNDNLAGLASLTSNAFLFLGDNYGPAGQTGGPGSNTEYYFPIGWNGITRDTGDSGPAMTQTTIGMNAALTGRNTIVNAVSTYDLGCDAQAYTTAGGATGTSTALTDICDTAHVKIDRGAKITGSQSVDIEARHDAVSILDSAQTILSVLTGGSSTYTYTFILGLNNPYNNPNNLPSLLPGFSQVTAWPTATISTPNLTVRAMATFVHVWKYQNSQGGSFLFRSDNWPREPEVCATRYIYWNANVASGGGAAAYLLKVNADGTVDPSSTIPYSIDTVHNQITVGSISSAGSGGTITFDVNPVALPAGPTSYYKKFDGGPNGSGKGMISSTTAPYYQNPNDLPTFYSGQTTTGPIQILNSSTMNLVINTISVLPQGATNAQMNIKVEDDSNFISNFKVGPTFGAPTLVDIENRSTTGTPNITLMGLIDNPTGTTEILNPRGNILSAGPQAIVRTNILDVEAAQGQIGSGANALTAQLVTSVGPNHMLRGNQITVLAGGSAYLNLKGILRSPAVPGILWVPLQSIHAGGNIVVTLQEGERDSSPQTAPGSITVIEVFKNNTTTTYSSNVAPDPGLYVDSAAPINSTYFFGDVTAGLNINLQGMPITHKTINIEGYTNINSNGPGTGYIDASTNGEIFLTETAGAMRVNSIQSTGGDVVLKVSALPQVGQDLSVLDSGQVVSDVGSVYLEVGGNIEIPASSQIKAGESVYIYGHVQNMAPAGVTIDVLGKIKAKEVRVVAQGNVDSVTIGGSLAAGSSLLVGGNLGSLHIGGDLMGQVVVTGNLGQLGVNGMWAGTVAVGGDVGQGTVNGNGSLKRSGGIVTAGLFSGQLVVLGNIYGDLTFMSDVTGRIAVKGHAVMGLDSTRFGILGNIQIAGSISSSGAIFSDGLIGDAAGGTVIQANGVAGTLAAKENIALGNIGSMTGTMFPNASGVNGAAIDALFTDNQGNSLTIDTTAAGLNNLALILDDLASLQVDGTGNLKGKRP